MAFQMTDKNGMIGSEFISADALKRLVPQVCEWRQDESRPMGWNGWLADHETGQPVPFSGPDYLITFVSARINSATLPARTA